MKKLIFSLFTIGTFSLGACNNGTNQSPKGHDMSKMTNDAKQHAAPEADTLTTEISPAFTGIDPHAATAIHTILDHYIRIKNALVNGDDAEASNGAKAMANTLSKIDKSFFTPEQKKLYDANREDLIEHTEHIAQKTGDIEHQRTHFSMMSEDIYSLAKGFGGGHTLYHDYCPMYKNNGGMWLSETKEIKNPYFGNAMLSCGKLVEVIK